MGAEGDERHERAILPRAGVDLLVNVISLLAFAGLAITGLFFMEERGGPAKGLHEQLGYLMVALVVVHVVRHSRWIASVSAGKLLGDTASRRRAWAGRPDDVRVCRDRRRQPAPRRQGSKRPRRESHRRAAGVER